jgi:hypothetical protein
MAAPRRPRRVRTPRAPRIRTGGASWTTTGLAAGGGDLHEAAMVIAKDAYNRASTWSSSVPASLSVEGDDQLQTISFSAPAAYPGETRARHPLFAQGPKGAGGRGWDHWYGPPGSPFLRPALDARADDATERYAQVVDKIARENGWTD